MLPSPDDLASESSAFASRYRLGRELGRGTSGTVHAAFDTRLEREVAIKILRRGASSVAVQRFTREARTMAALEHPNIVRVHDLGDLEDGTPFVVMELLRGETLAERIAARGALPIDDALSIACQLLDALAAAHDAGVLHRDIKPANVMIVPTDEGERVKLLDFGVALLREAERLTTQGTVLGSPAYLPPERVRGADADVRSDVYSAAVTIYEALAGFRPFEAESPIALRAKILVDTAKPLAAARPDLPIAIGELVECGMAREPGHRFGSARAFRAALARERPQASAPVAPSITPTSRSTPGALVGGRYRILRPIGSGGVGEVFEATHTELGRRVALKIVRAGAGVGRDHLARLEREARAAARLGHPNIVSVIDFGTSDTDGAFLVMELLRGESLAERIAREGRLRQDEVIEIALQVLDGLAAAHDAGMVHRDLKPANVFLVPLASGGHLVKLVDFGIVKLREEELAPKLTHAGMVLGTVSYMAPEQVRMQPTDARADVYSMGATMYEALSGRTPYPGENALEVAREMQLGPPPEIAGLVRDLDPLLARIVSRALAGDPGARYANAAEMRDELATRARVMTAIIEPPARSRSSARRVLFAGATMLAFATTAIGAGWIASSSAAPAAPPAPRAASAPAAAPEPEPPVALDPPEPPPPVVRAPEPQPAAPPPIEHAVDHSKAPPTPPARARRPRPIARPRHPEPAPPEPEREPGILDPFG